MWAYEESTRSSVSWDKQKGKVDVLSGCASLLLWATLSLAVDLSLAQKQKIYIAAGFAHREAVRLADKQIRKRFPETRSDVIQRNGKVYDRECERLIAPTLKRFRIEESEVEAIVVEGGRDHWPAR